MAIPPLSDLESVKKHQRLTWPQGAYDPLPDYQRLTCPILFIVGAFDSNVPAKEGSERIAAAMAAVNHADFTAAIIPQAEHGLTLMPPEVHDPIAARAARDTPVRQYAPEYFPLMVEWIKARCGLE
jgi:pimeloyl-ACP methyl ester carboxylesterase